MPEKNEPRVVATPAMPVVRDFKDVEKEQKAQAKEDEKERKEAEKAVEKELRGKLEQPFKPVDDKAPARADNVAPRVINIPLDADKEFHLRVVETYHQRALQHRTNAKTAEDRRLQDIANEQLRMAAEYDRLAEEAARQGGVA